MPEEETKKKEPQYGRAREGLLLKERVRSGEVE